MDLSQESCPYCGHTGLTLGYWQETAHFIQCEGCGAQGPRSPLAEKPTSISPLTDESLLRTVIDESPDIILMKDFDGDFLLCNESLARLYGSTPAKMIGKSDADFNPNEEQVEFYKENIRQVMRSGKLQIVEEASTDSDTGEVRYFQSIKKPLKGPDGSDRILVIAHDITELKRAHQLIEEKERRYAYAMAAAGEGIWDWDIPGNRVYHNRKWCDLLGLDSSHTSHEMSVLSGLIHPDDHDAVMAALEQALADDGVYSHEHRMLRGDGTVFWGYDRGRVVEWDESGQPVRMVGSITDITDRKRAEQKLAEAKAELEKSNQLLEHLVSERTEELANANRELQRMAVIDPLTGTGNRFQLESWLTDKAGDLPIAVLMLDIDHFKKVNDTYGHKLGDTVLKQVAAALREQLRDQDLIIRFGGEEFLLVLAGANEQQSVQTAERLRAYVEQLAGLPIHHPVTVSIGMSAGTVSSFDQLQQTADEYLYAAKAGGRNQVVSSHSYLPESPLI